MRSLVLCGGSNNMAAVVPLAKSAGLGIELQSFYLPDALDEPAAALARHRELLEGFEGLRALHGPLCDLCPGSLDPLVRQVTGHRFEQAFAVGRQLGVDHFVLHHGYVPNTSSPAAWIARSSDFWRQVLAGAPAGSQVHLENLLEEGPDLQLELVQRVGGGLGICLDLGHAHAFSRLPVVEWVGALGPALTYCHLHDNHGARDEHLPLGEGNLPLGEALAALEAHAPGAIWAIEADPVPSLAWLRANGFFTPQA